MLVLKNIDDIGIIITDFDNFNPRRCLLLSNLIHTCIYNNYKQTLTQKVYVKSCLHEAAPPSEL